MPAEVKTYRKRVKCTTCKGTAKVNDLPCPKCKSGRIWVTVEKFIPKKKTE